MAAPLTSDEALDLLIRNPERYKTPEELRSLASRVDADSPGKITVLYSGPVSKDVHSTDLIKSMRDAREDVRLIDNSEAAKFLQTRQFISATAEAHGIRYSDITEQGYRGPATDWLYSATDGPWADASGRFADATKGEVRTIVSGAQPDRVFAMTEVRRTLDNTKATPIEGIPREELVALEKQHGSQSPLEAIIARSRENVGQMRVAVDAQGNPLLVEGKPQLFDSRAFFDRSPGVQAKTPDFDNVTRRLDDLMPPPSDLAIAGKAHVEEILAQRYHLNAGGIHPNLIRGTGGAVVLGAAVEAYQWKQTLEHANTFRNTLGNDTAANEALMRQGASSASNLVGGAVGVGAAATLSLGSGGTFALVAADAYFFSAAADKAVTLWQQDKIYSQTSNGVEWEFKGKDWVREDLRADFVRDGVDNPQKQLIAAPFDKARELSYHASVEAVEQQLGKVPVPRNPFEQPANAADAYSARPSPWTYSTESAQWSRQLVTQEGDEVVGAKYGVEIATGERPAQLSAQALRTIDANLASGPAAIAAQYEVGYTQRGYQHEGQLPPSIHISLDPNLLQASDEKRYRRDEQGQWRERSKFCVSLI